MSVVLRQKKIQECRFIGDYLLCPKSLRRKVPVYEVTGLNGLNQIIGYAKYKNINQKILYRGEANLHNTMMPSLYRNLENPRGQSRAWVRLRKLISNALADIKFAKSSGISKLHHKWQRELSLEALLQHYGIATRCIDVVDNHWIALWFGSNRCRLKQTKSGLYGSYSLRMDDEGYQYVILYSVSRIINFPNDYDVPKDIYAIDLRDILPSIYLRPHAQHGWIIRNGKIPMCDDVGMAENVIGILKIGVGNAKRWLGNGSLQTMSNLFPSPLADQGYDIFLSRDDLFGKNAIVRYL